MKYLPFLLLLLFSLNVHAKAECTTIFGRYLCTLKPYLASENCIRVLKLPQCPKEEDLSKPIKGAARVETEQDKARQDQSRAQVEMQYQVDSATGFLMHYQAIPSFYGH
jgi:hypothetical protein